VSRPTEYFDYLYYTWNIDRARELLKNRRRDKRPTTINVDEIFNAISWGGFLGVSINEEYALTQTDLTQPLIFGWIKIKKTRDSDEPHGWFQILIDGHHRLYRAKQEGLTVLPAYILTKKENHEAAEGMRRPPLRKNPDEKMQRYKRAMASGDIGAKIKLLRSYRR